MAVAAPVLSSLVKLRLVSLLAVIKRLRLLTSSLLRIHGAVWPAAPAVCHSVIGSEIVLLQVRILEARCLLGLGRMLCLGSRDQVMD